MKKKILVLFSVLMVFMLLMTACGAKQETIRIGSKEFTEQFVLANMYELLLQDAGLEAEYIGSVGGTTENHDALINGEIDIYPEYTGTALLTILEGSFDSSMTGQDVYNAVKEGYEGDYDLAVLEPTKFNNTYCLTMKKDMAAENGIKTMSDLSAKAGDFVFGTTQEFTEREDGLPGLQEMYGGFNFKEVSAVDPGLLYAGLDEGEIDVTTCFGTDGQIAAYDLLVLEDDMRFWPPYPVAPVVRADTLEAHPEIAEVLNPLAALLDNETMSALNWEVAGNAREADEVAKEFLLENGLISE